MNTSGVEIEPIVGRYVRISLNGKPHRIYFEEAGAGTPLLCLHTAGSDTRQYRALMNEARVTQRFRVICFDLPWHGKSSPPAGWHEERYQLGSKEYTDIILSVAQALSLERPVVMGCSIGGRIVLHLALHHAKQFRGLIGLQSGAHVDPYYDLDWLHRPDVHGGEMCAGIVSGLVGPASPTEHRWETLWHYMQSGPGVFKGDLHFYTADGDIRKDLTRINTQDCPLWLLTGEYDYSCTPEDTALLGKSIPGSKWQIMKGMGHFPMSEDPERFLSYLLPVLDEIA
ncbi:alpha/beta fold hydrolase [Bordetella genomosp. 4]|uniref:Alpha/beta hydrolase n=1 Tax=Bordetella genomosp. 4 TaxID=463044 RepID=A0A261U5W6_9BORD|nr:alpha/beta hydrolase [Bordetella genomosp. 4]OZI56630.1 alpha/beta hydrolase [Bordetella genomosp. 4]